jgi:hypothetical protein
VEVARRNEQRYQVDGKVSLFCGDLYEPFRDHREAADMSSATRPYVPTTSLKKQTGRTSTTNRLSPSTVGHMD